MCFPLSLVEVEVDLHHIEGTMILRTDTGKTGRKKRERERETLRFRRAENSIVSRRNGTFWSPSLVIHREVIVTGSLSK